MKVSVESKIGEYKRNVSMERTDLENQVDNTQ